MTCRTFHWVAIPGTLLALALAVHGVRANAEITSVPLRIYRLTAGSTFARGCFPPCLCPVLVSTDLHGTFTLTPLRTEPPSLFDVFAVRDVRWKVKIGSSEVAITGSGTYERGGEFALEQRLALDLAIGGDNPQHFDSGFVVGGSEFPKISIAVSLNSGTCFDTVIDVRAEPLPGCL